MQMSIESVDLTEVAMDPDIARLLSALEDDVGSTLGDAPIVEPVKEEEIEPLDAVVDVAEMEAIVAKDAVAQLDAMDAVKGEIASVLDEQAKVEAEADALFVKEDKPKHALRKRKAKAVVEGSPSAEEGDESSDATPLGDALLKEFGAEAFAFDLTTGDVESRKTLLNANRNKKQRERYENMFKWRFGGGDLRIFTVLALRALRKSGTTSIADMKSAFKIARYADSTATSQAYHYCRMFVELEIATHDEGKKTITLNPNSTWMEHFNAHDIEAA
jgi:hypothetical protein